jgi:hypothetical protein
MKPRLSRLAQLREDQHFALVLLVLGILLGALSFIPQPHTGSPTPPPQPVSTTPSIQN